MLRIFLSIGLLLLLFSCNTVKPVYDPGVAVERYFRYAQDERNRKNYHTAIAYYDIIIDNFANRPDKVIAAEYEKGSLFFRMKKYKQALEMFDIVFAKMNNPATAQAVSPAVAYLVRDLKSKTEDILNKGQ